MKIRLKIELADGKTIELSEDKARELYFKLHEYFGIKENYIPVYPEPWTNPWWNPPIITYGSDSAKWKPTHPEITC
jgi:hypothetical protein